MAFARSELTEDTGDSGVMIPFVGVAQQRSAEEEQLRNSNVLLRPTLIFLILDSPSGRFFIYRITLITISSMGAYSLSGNSVSGILGVKGIVVFISLSSTADLP